MRRGPKPKGSVRIEWSPEFAYAIGLIATDGSLSKDGRHIILTSKDTEQLRNFAHALGIPARISRIKNGQNMEYGRIQFSDALFYRFLEKIGLTPNKSKTLSALCIPSNCFFDFFRGVIDGDGSFYSYFDRRWKSSFMYYLTLVSASSTFIDWVREELRNRLDVSGHVTRSRHPDREWYQLKYAKREALKILKSMYYAPDVMCLGRKKLKIEAALAIMGEDLCAGGEISRRTTLRW